MMADMTTNTDSSLIPFIGPPPGPAMAEACSNPVAPGGAHSRHPKPLNSYLIWVDTTIACPAGQGPLAGAGLLAEME